MKRIDEPNQAAVTAEAARRIRMDGGRSCPMRIMAQVALERDPHSCRHGCPSVFKRTKAP